MFAMRMVILLKFIVNGYSVKLIVVNGYSSYTGLIVVNGYSVKVDSKLHGYSELQVYSS